VEEEVPIRRYQNHAAQTRRPFYLVTATIAMHNMMVEERMSKHEMESDCFYEVSHMPSYANSHDINNASENMDGDDDGDGDVTVVGNFDTNFVRENILTYKIVQERWKKLYCAETSLRLQDAVKKHAFKKHFGDDGTLTWDDMTEDYDPLLF
jgi:hypothetical protein